jgi:hypothetical protein
MVGKAADFVYLHDLDTTIRRSSRPEMYNTHLAGGTLLISRGDLERRPELASGEALDRRLTLINRIRGAAGSAIPDPSHRIRPAPARDGPYLGPGH